MTACARNNRFSVADFSASNLRRRAQAADWEGELFPFLLFPQRAHHMKHHVQEPEEKTKKKRRLPNPRSQAVLFFVQLASGTRYSHRTRIYAGTWWPAARNRSAFSAHS